MDSLAEARFLPLEIQATPVCIHVQRSVMKQVRASNSLSVSEFCLEALYTVMETLEITRTIKGTIGTLELNVDALFSEGKVEIDGRTVKAHELVIHLVAGEPAVVIADGIYL